MSGQIERLLKETVKRYGRVDILVNNAGIFGGRRLAETTTEAFDSVMNVNLRGNILLLPGRIHPDEKAGRGVDH